MRNIICINCSNRGHTFKECYFPITSYGIIGFKKFKDATQEDKIKFILVQRKDTMGYIDFVRGKYDTRNKKEDIFKILIGEMTLEEKKRLLKYDFDTLWDKLWINKESRIYKNEYELAKKKFNNIDVKGMIEGSLLETKWDKTEFSIPKGRRNNSENVLECAIREFTEETGFKKTNIINIINNRKPIEEVFFGSNDIAYRHVYYIAEIDTEEIPEIDKNNVLQAGEVKTILWFSYKEAMNVFRNYETTKRVIIHTVNKILKNYFSFKNK